MLIKLLMTTSIASIDLRSSNPDLRAFFDPQVEKLVIDVIGIILSGDEIFF